MIESNDGGANVSTNGGRTWTTQDQQPTAQFYRVALDNDFPYHAYGAQQDNSTVRISTRSDEGSIGVRDWYDVGGGESGWLAPDPKDSEIVYAGSYDGLLTRYDHRTGQLRDITVWPDNPMGSGAEAMKYRFQWTYPIVFSPNDPNTLYCAGDHRFQNHERRNKLGSDLGPISPATINPSKALPADHSPKTIPASNITTSFSPWRNRP